MTATTQRPRPRHRSEAGRPTENRRVFLETHGCTTNLGDSQLMAGILQAAGHEIVHRIEDADLLVLNTCTVVQTTDQRLAHVLSEWRRSGKPVIAAGCMAAAQPGLIAAAHPDARLLPPRQLDQVAAVAAGQELTPGHVAKAGLPRATGPDAVIPLAEGCFFSCSYCLTKQARGEQSSHPQRLLISDIRDAVNRGAVEVRLTSQDASGYGLDIGTDLARLLNDVTEIGGDFRVRVGMMHPSTAHRILDGLLDAMDHPKVYKFLHLPVQSGSPRMLKAMARGHGMDAFHEVVAAFRRRFPRGILSTDVIVGFPGETPEDHAATLRLLYHYQPEHVNVTRWSARPGTPATSLPGRLPSATMKRRSRQVAHHLQTIWAARQAARIGEELDVVVTERAKKAGTTLGRGPGHEPVALPAAELPVPCRVRARVIAARPTYLIAAALRAPQMLGKAPGERPLPILAVLP